MRDDLIVLRSKDLAICEVLGKRMNLDMIERKEMVVGFLVWARYDPKDIFLRYINLSRNLSKFPLHVMVDDVCSNVYMQIERTKQEELKRKYADFFQGCITSFRSDESVSNSSDFLRFISKINVKEYKAFLPQRLKTEDKLPTLKMTELLHTYLEIEAIKSLGKDVDAILLGKRSTNIAYLYHNKIDSKQNFIIVDFVNRYLEKEIAK